MTGLDRFPLFAAALLGLGGCAPGNEGEAPCAAGGKCDEAEDVRSQLDGLDNPIADWLRESEMTREGLLETSYLDAIGEIGEQMGCGMDSMKTFVLSDDLIMGEPFPRVISTLCSDQTRAADFFIAGSFPDPERPGDIDLRNLETFAWDQTQKRYVFFAMLPVEDSETEVQVQVEPRRCEGCHLNASSLDADHMPMIPIMNELTQPWPHWNAEPDFPSHSFVLPDETTTADGFLALTGDGRLGSAVAFEQIIRTAQTNRVIAERVRLRGNKPADVGEAMSLLRPIFCDEQVNYVTEDHGSSVLPVEAIIAGGTREMFLAISATDWPWPWLNDGTIRFDESADQPLAMIPVRGNHDVEYERRMVAVRGLDPMDVLRVRALDWKRPVFSEFRCDLWKEAKARLREDPPEVDPDMRNVHLFPTLYDEIMKHEGEPLIPDDPEQLIAMADAAAPDEVEVVDLTGFGDLLQDWADEIAAAGGRLPLRERRDRRLCVVDRDFPNRPALPPRQGCAREPRFPEDVSPQGFGEASPMDGSRESTPPPVFTGESDVVRLIPDGQAGGVTSVIDLGGPSLLGGSLVSVRVAIDHDWRGDLTLRLTSPAGETVDVVSFDAGDSADDVDELFFVGGLSGSTPASGPWSLTVIDDQAGVHGFLEGWSLGVGGLAPRLAAEGARTPPGL